MSLGASGRARSRRARISEEVRQRMAAIQLRRTWRSESPGGSANKLQRRSATMNATWTASSASALSRPQRRAIVAAQGRRELSHAASSWEIGPCGEGDGAPPPVGSGGAGGGLREPPTARRGGPVRGHRRAVEGKEAGKWTFPTERIDVSTGHDLVCAGLRLRVAWSLQRSRGPTCLSALRLRLAARRQPFRRPSIPAERARCEEGLTRSQPRQSENVKDQQQWTSQDHRSGKALYEIRGVVAEGPRIRPTFACAAGGRRKRAAPPRAPQARPSAPSWVGLRAGALQVKIWSWHLYLPDGSQGTRRGRDAFFPRAVVAMLVRWCARCALAAGAGQPRCSERVARPWWGAREPLRAASPEKAAAFRTTRPSAPPRRRPATGIAPMRTQPHRSGIK